jgi:uncharacterized ParB-like nuclease family protein
VETLRARDDFDAARFRAFRRAVVATLARRSHRLLALDPILEAAGLEARSDAGIQEIPLDQVIGSAVAARTVDFDPAFLPVNRRLRDRWSRIYSEMTEGGELPPIDVYELDGGYYVIDGHHRVSVARSLQRATIRARVTEVRTRAPIASPAKGAELLRAAEYASFLQQTELDRTRPQARLEVSRLGRYDEILKHVLGHAYFLGLERGREVPLPEAAASWYDSVYRPVADVIRRHAVLERLPGWTETDLYVEVTRRWLQLGKSGAPAGPHEALHALLRDRAAIRKVRRRWPLRRPRRV